MTQALTEHQGSTAQVTLSGRELAMQRRQAMARLGKAGTGKIAATSRAQAVVRSAAQVVPAQASSNQVSVRNQESLAPSMAGLTSATAVTLPVVAPVKAARARREALSRSGKNALPSIQSQTSQRRTRAAAQQAATQGAQQLLAAGQMPASATESGNAWQAPALNSGGFTNETTSSMLAPAIQSVTAPTGRALAQARRNVMAREGKSGLKRVAQAVKIASALPEQNWQAVLQQGATGRQIAMQHRLVRSLTGRSGSDSGTRPAGRTRPTVAKGEAPVKVEEGHTLSGQRVTGTMVDQSKHITGMENGANRAVTGTEYIGAELFERLGAPRPQAAPPKVVVSESAKGKTVTGAPMGRSPKVTGDEVGATRQLSGTFYVAAPEQAAAAPEKVAQTHTAQGGTVTGTSVGLGSQVTGGEAGGCAKVTGTEYLSAEQLRAKCSIEPTPSPSKVSMSTTMGNRPVSGSAVGRSSKVTGDEPGACRPITGSQYYNTNDFASLCATPSPRRSVSVMRRPTRQDGEFDAETFSSPKSAGDVGLEASCATGHPFGLDRRHAVATKADSRSRQATSVAVIPAALITGDRPGAGGAAMTGDERGACLLVSGTPYVEEDNRPLNCPPTSSGRFVPRPPAIGPEDTMQPPQDFSIVSPARMAWEQRGGMITGAAMENERITGPINKAGGLITGTPDFRHRAASPQPRDAFLKESDTAAVSASRLSGEGSQAGVRITGDAWQATSRVTGTEGASAFARNPSQRGESRVARPVGARDYRAVERQAAPETKVTGSSGSTTRGALVTVSGGARA
jgi:hypothetical protein